MLFLYISGVDREVDGGGGRFIFYSKTGWRVKGEKEKRGLRKGDRFIFLL